VAEPCPRQPEPEVFVCTVSAVFFLDGEETRSHPGMLVRADSRIRAAKACFSDRWVSLG